MSAREKANLAETAARAVRFAGEKLGRPKGLGPSAERMLRIAGPAGQEKHLPRINPMIGAELEEKIEEFYRTVNEGRQRHRFGRDRLQDQFKLMVVTAIAQGQVKSRGEMHEFIRELGKENGWNLDPFKVETQLFTEKQEIEKLNGIFSSYKDLVRRGVIKIQGPRQDEEESAPARRRTA
ncbi:MAG: hypothetical protein HY392_03720 [Candidatus Diapherotrites archaeon]|nr:hypothetical protein [Candidatus Diapherotrites archaeon]